MVAQDEASFRESGPATDSPRSSDYDDVRARILRAAEERFVRYGFGKTTMAEIAADCSMSAGNLYRFFDNKGDIAAASASQWMMSLEADLSAIAQDTTRSPSSRLKSIIHAKLDALADLVEAEPHLEELIEHVCKSRDDLVASHRIALQRLYARVIADGVAAGDYDVEDAEASADAVQVATVGLFHHNIICTVPFDKLRSDADKIMGLVLRGLGQR